MNYTAFRLAITSSLISFIALAAWISNTIGKH